MVNVKWSMLSGIKFNNKYAFFMRENDISIKLAHRIKELRKITNMSQEQLAEKADLHPSFIGKIERLENHPTIIVLEKIAKAFKMTLIELLDFEENKDKENIQTMIDSLNNATTEINRVKADIKIHIKNIKK